MDNISPPSFENAVLLPRPVLRISYDIDLDFLWGLTLGEVLDGHLDDETEVVATRFDDETGELEDAIFLYRRGPDGPLIGFGAEGAFEIDLDGTDASEPQVWAQPRFDVPTLALRDVAIGEILLAARHTLLGSTPDVLAFDAAVAHGTDGRWADAEDWWRQCLAAGEMKAHFGLGYTLVELGRPREAMGQLAMYTEICPRNSWAWTWRGRAAVDIGETAEARTCLERAIACEQAGSFETDAAELLAAL